MNWTMELWHPSDLEWVCCFGQGHQEEDPGPMSGKAKSPEATEQNGEEAHRAESPGAQIRSGERRRKPSYQNIESTDCTATQWA
jgi:hypothetical protein